MQYTQEFKQLRLKKIKEEIKDTRKKLYLESLLKKGQVARDEAKKYAIQITVENLAEVSI